MEPILVNKYRDIYTDFVRGGRRAKADSLFAAEAVRLSEVLRTARDGVPLSQEVLASQAGVSLSWLSKLERGEIIEPGFFPVLAVLRELGLGADVQGLFPISQEAPRSG